MLVAKGGWTVGKMGGPWEEVDWWLMSDDEGLLLEVCRLRAGLAVLRGAMHNDLQANSRP